MRRLIAGVTAALVITILLGGCATRGERPLSVRLEGTGDETAPLQEGRRLKMAVAAVLSPGVVHQTYEGLARLLSRELGQPVDLVQRRTYSEINHMIEVREVDMGFVCTLPLVIGHEAFGMEALVMPVIGGSVVYRSYLIVRDDDPAQELADLEGRTFAFTDPLSFSGRLTAVHWLCDLERTAGDFFSSTLYTNSHDNSVRAVARGLVDGAVVNSVIWNWMSETDPQTAGRTRVIAESVPAGTPPFVVHPDLDPDFRESLRAFLLDLHTTVEGREVLDLLGVDRFVVPLPDAYDSVDRMWREHSGEMGD